MNIYVSTTFKKIYFLVDGALLQVPTNEVSFGFNTQDALKAPIVGRRQEAQHNRIVKRHLESMGKGVVV